MQDEGQVRLLGLVKEICYQPDNSSSIPGTHVMGETPPHPLPSQI